MALYADGEEINLGDSVEVAIYAGEYDATVAKIAKRNLFIEYETAPLYGPKSEWVPIESCSMIRRGES